MRKFLGFVVLFGLGFATGAYVLNTYFPKSGGRLVIAAPNSDTQASRVALTNLLQQRPETEPAPTNFETMLRTASQRIAPAVVNIDTAVRAMDWFGNTREVVAGRGSGVIISQDGYVVTNNHVIRVQGRLASQIVVTLQDGRQFSARVLGTDRRNDIALLKIDGTNLPTAQLGDSDRLQVGDWVIAVGNPFGLGTTVTAGIVSAIDRRVELEDLPSGLIQTDAAINQGNSGGALADSRGRLIGINTAIYSPVRANVGIGFAIPINRVRQVVQDILKYGFLSEAYLGIAFVDVSDPQIRERLRRAMPDLQFPRQGMLVIQVERGAPASRAGIQPGDVILQVDGRAVRTTEQMQEMLRLKQPGETVRLRIWREGRQLDLNVTLGTMP
ncbi:MAG: trypsin-like peptidase domain-containing protein [Fimbriimonadales bacterium]|nr:trypsin-like peptidase domain-containing protein [Fimbriimonadales bacterium]